MCVSVRHRSRMTLRNGGSYLETEIFSPSIFLFPFFYLLPSHQKIHQKMYFRCRNITGDKKRISFQLHVSPYYHEICLNKTKSPDDKLNVLHLGRSRSEIEDWRRIRNTQRLFDAANFHNELFEARAFSYFLVFASSTVSFSTSEKRGFSSRRTTRALSSERISAVSKAPKLRFAKFARGPSRSSAYQNAYRRDPLDLSRSVHRKHGRQRSTQQIRRSPPGLILSGAKHEAFLYSQASPTHAERLIDNSAEERRASERIADGFSPRRCCLKMTRNRCCAASRSGCHQDENIEFTARVTARGRDEHREVCSSFYALHKSPRKIINGASCGIARRCVLGVRISARRASHTNSLVIAREAGREH